MSRIKDRIPNQIALERVVDDVLKVSLTEFFSKTSQVRDQAVQSRNQLIIAVLVLVSAIVSLVFVSGKIFSYGWLILVALSLGVVYFISRFYFAYRDYVFVFNRELTPLIATALDRPVRHEQTGGPFQSVEDILRDSNLFNDVYNRLQTDDIYHLDGERSVSVIEVKIQRADKKGKNHYVRTLFHGSIVKATFPKVFNSITYVSTKSDKQGLVHNQFWNRLTGSNGISEVSLEWNQFADDLHVASNDQIEARTIFTPDFMIDLHDWWLEKRENMRLVLRGNELVMLLPDSEVEIGSVPLSSNEKKLKRHLLSVIKPLWRILTLVEDIKL